jgi:hypothetical protein
MVEWLLRESCAVEEHPVEIKGLSSPSEWDCKPVKQETLVTHIPLLMFAMPQSKEHGAVLVA